MTWRFYLSLPRFFDENSWKFDCVQKAETVLAISDLVPSEIVGQVFDVYCSPMEGGTDDEFSLNTDKVCRFYGDFLLAVNTAYLLTEFLEMWQNVRMSSSLAETRAKHNQHVGICGP